MKHKEKYLKTIFLERYQQDDKQTLGKLYFDSYSFHILELTWKDNQKQTSCIPVGEYEVVKRWSKKYDNHFHILNVPNRSYILVHAGNYNTSTKGCLLPGLGLKDINKDDYLDIINSKGAMEVLNRLLPDKFKIRIYYGNL